MVLSTIEEFPVEIEKKPEPSGPNSVDVKFEALEYSDGAVLEWTEEEERAIRHAIDWHTVPIATVLYLLCFLDRANIGNARIQGMSQDINIDGFRFNWVLSSFYIIYLFVEVPSNIVLKQFGPRYYIPFLVVGFGLTSLCTAFVRSYEGLIAARVFLGLFEGGAMPGLSFFLSSFYKREELLFRIGVLISSASMAGAFGGLLATGLSRIPPWGFDGMTIHTWRNIFFFEGFVTVLVGLFAPLWMPTDPATAYFLTDRQRAIAVERLQREHRADAMEPVNIGHVKKAVFCIHNYTCALGFFLINITVQGISVFMPTILNDLGWTATKAQLMSVPPYVLACLAAILVAYVSDKTRQRGVYLAIFSCVAVIGFAILRFETDANIRYMAVFFVTAGAFPGGPGFLSWAMNNSAGPSVRAVASAYVVTIGTIGGIVATWTYTFKDAPKYFVGHTINLVGQTLTVLLAVFGILYCLYENRTRAAGKRDHRLDGLNEKEQVPGTMRLLNTRTKRLQEFNQPRLPYAILSHTWGPEEVSLQDLVSGNGASLLGYKKLEGACEQALRDGFDYILTEAINSMWNWYRESRVCYAYLEDVAADSANPAGTSGFNYLEDVTADLIRTLGRYASSFIKSRWFTRGWTLQELIAPHQVVFYTNNWAEIGTRDNMREALAKVTNIDRNFFDHGVLGRYSIAQRMSWAAKRKTTRIEDQAYCLLGLFGVNMPLLYGEGEMAFVRLQEEIMRRTDDHSIFAWLQAGSRTNTGFLAPSPSCFSQSGSIARAVFAMPAPPYAFTNQGIHITLPALLSDQLNQIGGVDLIN
ncbi:major facilitator superfamily transporter [Colletotrichum plurivorum]|uniref:Major facilitator superfamily transporter n=1 Tax=Colletotrichum plurivorum TaxID=2175906 RepID=A0A8H6J4Y9_9PEZI|nr:major facilitator superfamily transporter [Colletotrichum plurivorum]